MKTPATETAHVLMTDRVGFSPLSIEEKTRLEQELLEAVRSCPAVQRQGPEDCLKLDGGDGISLVFFGEPTDAIEANPPTRSRRPSTSIATSPRARP